MKNEARHLGYSMGAFRVIGLLELAGAVGLVSGLRAKDAAKKTHRPNEALLGLDVHDEGVGMHTVVLHCGCGLRAL